MVVFVVDALYFGKEITLFRWRSGCLSYPIEYPHVTIFFERAEADRWLMHTPNLASLNVKIPKCSRQDDA
jgi:hypothetical protein